MEEIWKEVEGFEGLYWVSNLARVKNSKGLIMKQSIRGTGNYLRVGLSKEGKQMTINVHLLVAKAFVPNDNPEIKTIVNHIVPVSEGGTNEANNLEWTTYKENTQHALKRGNMRTKEVQQFDKQGNFIAEYFGAREAERQTGIRHISEVCNGKRATAGGFVWKYKN